MICQLVLVLARSILLLEVSSFCFNNSFGKSKKSFKQFVENFCSKLQTNFMYDFQKFRLICWSSLYNLRSISAQTSSIGFKSGDWDGQSKISSSLHNDWQSDFPVLVILFWTFLFYVLMKRSCLLYIVKNSPHNQRIAAKIEGNFFAAFAQIVQEHHGRSPRLV